MKKLLLIIASALLLLTGCQDAHATVNNPNEEIVKVGNTSITKGEVYSSLLANYGAYYTVSDATEKVVDAEVETTDELNTKVSEQVEGAKAMYGENWDYFLQSYGYDSEESFSKSILVNLKLTELVNKYVYENWDELVKEYNPRKAVVLSFSNTDSANAALVELKNGTDPQEVATAYESNSTGVAEIITPESTYTPDVMSIVNTASTTDDFAMIPSTDGVTTYIIKILETDPNNIQQEVVETLAKYDTIANKSDSYYFNKYKFTIYDKTLFDAMKASYPNYVVQK